jgi:hypothetical protein
MVNAEKGEYHVAETPLNRGARPPSSHLINKDSERMSLVPANPTGREDFRNRVTSHGS